MLLWLWDATGPGHFSGVTDDEARARQAVTACILDDLASIARVERAAFVMDGWLPCYMRTGTGWTARRTVRGINWRPSLPEERES